MKKAYIFQSQRLGFRNWLEEDVMEFAKMNADVDVMEHFPTTLTFEETAVFVDSLKCHYLKHGYTYFATETLEAEAFIGFIGLAFQSYPSDFTPAVDIGWRLRKSAWGKGYATEGAKRCLEFAFKQLPLEEVIATCTSANAKSEKVMEKIGMKKIGAFKHPKLQDYPDYETCLAYEIKKDWWMSLSKAIED